MAKATGAGRGRQEKAEKVNYSGMQLYVGLDVAKDSWKATVRTREVRAFSYLASLLWDRLREHRPDLAHVVGELGCAQVVEVVGGDLQRGVAQLLSSSSQRVLPVRLSKRPRHPGLFSRPRLDRP